MAGNGTWSEYSYPKFSAAEFARRHSLIRAEMGKRTLDCLILYGAYKEMYQANARWVTGCLEMFQYYSVFPREKDPTVLITHAGHYPCARMMSGIQDVRLVGQAPAAAVVKHIREIGMGKARIGLVGVHHTRSVTLPMDHYEVFRRELPDATFEVVTDMVAALQQVKSEEELEAYGKGAAYTDASMAALVAACKPGVSEMELYGELMSAGYRAGGEPDFALLGSTPMSDPVMPYPWHHPSLRRLRKGDIVLNEISIGHNGCSGQLIIPIALGEPPAEYRELYGVARETLERVAAVLKPGNSTDDVVKAAQPVRDAGMILQGPLIHGWPNPVANPFWAGLSGHRPLSEEPRYAFQENQLVMVEPNPTTEERKKGVFLGTLFVVTPQGGKNLHSHSLDFAIV